MSAASRRALACLAATSLVACGERSGAGPGTVRWDVRTPEGAALVVVDTFPERALALVARHRATGAVRGLPFAEGAALGVAGAVAAEEDVFLWAAGCRDLLLPRGSGPATLEYGPRVRIRVLVERGIPPPPAEIHLEVQWRGPGDAPDAPQRHGFPPAAPEGWLPTSPRTMPFTTLVATAGAPEVAFRVSGPGRYRVRWLRMEVIRDEHGSRSSGTGLPDGGTSIEVKDVAEEQAFDLPIRREKWSETGG